MSVLEIPAGLLANAQRAVDRLGADLHPDALRVFALSDFAATVAVRDAAWFAQALAADEFAAPLDAHRINAEVAVAVAESADMRALQACLRLWRNRFQLWVVWRHLACAAPVEETCAVLSALADAFIELALSKVYGWALETHGVPRGIEGGAEQRLVVLALGKLGAGELNVSSDVDLIFAYPEAGATESGQTNQQFFVRLGQQLIEALDPVTEDGFVFRVDLRLRPFGESGPLVMHFAAMEDYFVAQGRDWERYAFIKARACAGDIAAGEALLETLKPFVYRRYLDFGAVDALREMKARLYAERNNPNDVKLGPGGIRDVEFAVQVQQLIWGGRQPDLQEPNLLTVLPKLVARGHLSETAHVTLAEAYRFLRNTEHSLQTEADRQTHILPAMPNGQTRLALSLGFDCYPAFENTLNGHRAGVEAIFAASVGEAPAGNTLGQRVWLNTGDQALLAEFGFHDASAIKELLRNLAGARDRPSVGAEGRERLDRLMPELLDQVRLTPDPDLSLARVVPVLRSILRRSAYLALLRENPHTLSHFVELTHKSKWLADTLTRHPAFFDALLDKRQLSALPAKARLQTELRERLAEVAAADFEHKLDVLREYKAHHVFNVALAEVRGTVPLMNASDYLTYLAEVVLAEALGLAWADNLERYPHYASPRPFIIVGYGKLGGIELGHSSDLDLVFIHDLPPEAAQFLHRLVRRLLHILTVPTYLGTLYEIDMRLRPSGNAGTLVSSLDAFTEYQRSNAGVWEHQALVRARVVVGDQALAARFSTTRLKLLCQPRDREALKGEISGMRARMAEQHHQSDDLKRGSGGIVDIEFVVQYLVLAWAHEYPVLAEYTDNIRILETAEHFQLLPARMAQNLRKAYLALRSEWHRSVLDLPDSDRAAHTLTHHRTDVRAAWRHVIGN
ncbi:MAG: bifunctional [glutamate--ammonia ligase]-adenylyl-L-tyrosine phosphorylase/[glutamate--ammonia-ligase] adenylyltransferase [Gammaproteobacteria bacterium]|nr:bifunctional [glutamate--ammonia ligase]-adenylyl-L-tyrosine phosphorylase/[glutamate--ammonia-ligase] adenylyltransferase [Gammaproteobacteria bacterium]